MKTIIMAGGKGTRIASIASDVPKPMIRICGKPILEHQIENLKACGLTDITLVIGHLGNVIQDYFGDGSRFGVKIDYFVETEPLGTAGALFQMNLTEDFLLLCGDVIMDVDFNRFIRFHKEHDAWASLISHPNGHPYDSSLLVTETLPPTEKGGLPVDTHRVVRWLSKEDERLYYQNRVNAGIEIISPQLLRCVEDSRLSSLVSPLKKVDLDRDVLKPNIKSGRIYAYDTPEYIKDMGTPDRYYEVEHDIETGLVHARNLSVPQRAIFLDRDGTINKSAGFLTRPEQIELIEGAAEAIKMINKSGYLAIVVTNQPVIARGDVTWEELQTIHNKLETELGKQGAFVDAIYLCPHHPKSGFEGERPEYKHPCDCRKPKPGLLLKAAADYNIDLSQSYMIGDFVWDVQAGQAAGVKRALKIEPDKPNALLCAVREIMDNRKKKKLVYCNPDNYFDTDCTVIKHLAKEYRVIWYPILHTIDECRKYSITDLEEYAKENDIEFKPIILNYRRRSIKCFFSYFSLLCEIKRQKADVIFTSNAVLHWHLMVRLIMSNRNIVHGLHDVEHHSSAKFRFVLNNLSKLRVRIYKYYITYSKSQQIILKEKYGKDSLCVGMSSKDFGNSTLTARSINNQIKLLFFGSISRYKGLDLLIQSLEELYSEGVNNLHLSVCGKGTHWDECKEYIKSPELYNLQVRFIDNSEIPDLMCSHHFLILPYRDVTNSGPMMIGVNYMIPLIAPDMGCFKDVYSNKSAFLYQPGKLKETLRRVSEISEKEYQEMKESCSTLKEHYSEEAVAQRYLAIFNSI